METTRPNPPPWLPREGRAPSPRQEVRRLVIDEHLHPQEIAVRMQGVLSRSTVKQYVKEIYASSRREGVDLAPIEPLPEKCKARHPHRHTGKSISLTHVRVGVRINRFRVGKGLDAPTFSRDLGFANQMSLRSMELGMHDFTLTELQKVATVLGFELGALVQSPAMEPTEREVEGGK